MIKMLVFRSGFRLLWALLTFASTIHGQDDGPDPINDFCALSGHMSEWELLFAACLFAYSLE